MGGGRVASCKGDRRTRWEGSQPRGLCGWGEDSSPELGISRGEAILEAPEGKSEQDRSGKKGVAVAPALRWGPRESALRAKAKSVWASRAWLLAAAPSP